MRARWRRAYRRRRKSGWTGKGSSGRGTEPGSVAARRRTLQPGKAGVAAGPAPRLPLCSPRQSGGSSEGGRGEARRRDATGIRGDRSRRDPPALSRVARAARGGGGRGDPSRRRVPGQVPVRRSGLARVPRRGAKPARRAGPRAPALGLARLPGRVGADARFPARIPGGGVAAEPARHRAGTGDPRDPGRLLRPAPLRSPLRAPARRDRGDGARGRGRPDVPRRHHRPRHDGHVRRSPSVSRRDRLRPRVPVDREGEPSGRVRRRCRRRARACDAQRGNRGPGGRGPRSSRSGGRGGAAEARGHPGASRLHGGSGRRLRFGDRPQRRDVRRDPAVGEVPFGGLRRRGPAGALQRTRVGVPRGAPLVAPIRAAARRRNRDRPGSVAPRPASSTGRGAARVTGPRRGRDHPRALRSLRGRAGRLHPAPLPRRSDRGSLPPAVPLDSRRGIPHVGAARVPAIRNSGGAGAGRRAVDRAALRARRAGTAPGWTARGDEGAGGPVRSARAVPGPRGGAAPGDRRDVDRRPAASGALRPPDPAASERDAGATRGRDLPRAGSRRAPASEREARPRVLGGGARRGSAGGLPRADAAGGGRGARARSGRRGRDSWRR